MINKNKIKPELITRIAKESGMVEGPWANGNKERIWQENREFPDALEMFANLIAKECVKSINDAIAEQQKAGITQHTMGLNQARFAIAEVFGDEVLG